ncbi:MAG: shikimate dehydrogenase family protein [Planctomycetia bacterium]|jgi:shikimate dehydrogenase
MTSPALQEVLALLGAPAAGNPAQYLFERAIEAAGLDWRFVTFDVDPDRLADALAGVAALGMRGCLLSGPLCATAAQLLATRTPTADFAAAVNLVVREGDGLTGHMTAGRGAVEALRAHVDPAGCRVAIFGTTPACRAAALELALAGAAGIIVCDADVRRAEGLVDRLRSLHAAAADAIPWQPTIELPADIDVLVADGPPAALPEITNLRPDQVVAELLLAPDPAPFLRRAAGAGCCVVDGLEVHAARTAIDFHTLSGGEADTDMLREALDEFLA